MSRLVTCLALICVSATTWAAPVIVLTSPDQLDDLRVGETFRIDVTIENLAVGDRIEFLTADVIAPVELVSDFSTPLSHLDAAQQRGFTSEVFTLGASRFATGTFDSIVFDPTLPAPGPIGSDSLFFSFTGQTVSAGSGTIQLLFGNAAGRAGNGDPIDVTQINSPNLGFTAVPEPSTGWLMLPALALGLFRRVNQRINRPRADLFHRTW